MSYVNNLSLRQREKKKSHFYLCQAYTVLPCIQIADTHTTSIYADESVNRHFTVAGISLTYISSISMCFPFNVCNIYAGGYAAIARFHNHNTQNTLVVIRVSSPSSATYNLCISSSLSRRRRRTPKYKYEKHIDGI